MLVLLFLIQKKSFEKMNPSQASVKKVYSYHVLQLRVSCVYNMGQEFLDLE